MKTESETINEGKSGRRPEHKALYKMAYTPEAAAAYAAAAIQSVPAKPDSVLLTAIDGRCGAGKTTLAKALGKRFCCPVIHMDDFYLRLEQRTEARFSEPGGNVDRERFLAEVLRPLRERGVCTYRPYIAHEWIYGAPVHIAAAPIVIIEGSYSCHPLLAPFYDLKIFMTADRAVQEARILGRNGTERLELFRKRWIPFEERYFEAFQTEEKADLVIESR